MSGFFLNVFLIARAQEIELVEYRAENEAMVKQISSLTSDLAWYRSMAVRRGLDAPDTSEPSVVDQPPDDIVSLISTAVADTTLPPPPRVPVPTPPIDKPIVHRIPNNDMVERWKRLTQ